MVTGFRFGTKAETLERLSGALRSGVVLPLDYFTVGDWRHDADAILNRLWAREWARSAMVVRSSGQREDRDGASNAGHHLSRLHVTGRRKLELAVEEVIASFESRADEDQVLVQPELERVLASGVAASREPSGGGPYRVISWAEGADTEVVTAGRRGTQTWYSLAYERCDPPAPLAGVVPLVDELEELIGSRSFELEFGVVRDATVVLFQVRPLTVGGRGIPDARHREATAACKSQLHNLSRPHPPALGPETAFGVMPDWNPAEMIGVRPRPLSLSLYASLITDEIWAESRARYGYRDLRGHPLLVDFCGLPYIDARASFSSLVPAALDDAAAERLVAHYVARLRANPHLHDKIEFSIALTAYHFNVPRQATRLTEEGVLSIRQADELVEALRDITTAMMAEDGPYARDLEAVAGLARFRLERQASDPPLRRVRGLINLVRRRGTLPFAGLARAAFAAVGLVHSLVEHSILSHAEGEALLGSASEVPKQMRRDFARLDREAFLRRYGHLRPGTYDILSPRYDESSDRYFDWARRTAVDPRGLRFEPSAAQLRKIGDLVEAHGLGCGAAGLLEFIRGAVAARESAKLEFSRVVSELLVEVRRLGDQLGFSVHEMSYVTLAAIWTLTGERDDDRRAIAEAVRRGRERHAVTETLCAPALLRDPSELSAFMMLEDEPNFITRSRVVARVADVARGDPLDGAIAMIASADPGYDWVFTHDVAGLVTAFGGANSHMALRALELRVPAAIGVGEVRFKRWLRAGTLEIDAASRVVRATVRGPLVAGAALGALAGEED